MYATIDYDITHEITDNATLQLSGRMDLEAATIAGALRQLACKMVFPYENIRDDLCYDEARGLVWERGYHLLNHKRQESPRAVQLLQAADALDGCDFSRDFENDPATVEDIWGI